MSATSKLRQVLQLKLLKLSCDMVFISTPL
jgi:hypothetical protein